MAATRGEQIADAVGLSVRTLWRYFRNKESCAEPVVAQGVEWFTTMLRTWPRELSLEDHYRVVLSDRALRSRSGRAAHNLILAQMIELGHTEPAIRSAWLMTCDQVEQEMVEIIADRLQRPPDESAGRLHAAAATAVMRRINEELGAALLAESFDELDIRGVAERPPHAVRAATGGAIGDPVGPVS